MHINHEIAEMKKRMFTDDLLHTILEAYQQETEADGFGTSALEYRKGKATLLSLLNEPQKEILAQAEALCRENLKYALEFGFSQGTYAGFQQFFTDSTPERPFHTYIVEQLLTMPNMKRHPGYYENRTRFNQLFDQVGKALDAEQKESLVAVESA